MTEPTAAKEDPDLDLCARFLGDLGAACSYASKGKDLIDQMLETLRKDEDFQSFDLDLQSLLQENSPHITNLFISGGSLETFWGSF